MKANKKAQKQYQSDFRNSNPGLHSLYVHYAVQSLATIDKAMRELSALSKTTLFDMLAAMEAERKKLVDEDAAYAEADKLIKDLRAIDAGEQMPSQLEALQELQELRGVEKMMDDAEEAP